MIETHKDVIPEDEFTRNMVECYLAVRKENGPRQKFMLLTQRGDYMCHTEEGKEPSLKQVLKIYKNFKFHFFRLKSTILL